MSSHEGVGSGPGSWTCFQGGGNQACAKLVPGLSNVFKLDCFEETKNLSPSHTLPPWPHPEKIKKGYKLTTVTGGKENTAGSPDPHASGGLGRKCLGQPVREGEDETVLSLSRATLEKAQDKEATKSASRAGS